MYLYTDKKGKVVELKNIKSGNGDKALVYRKILEKKLKKVVIAWAHMGGDNPEI